MLEVAKDIVKAWRPEPPKIVPAKHGITDFAKRFK
jgi:hypothetical protein